MSFLDGCANMHGPIMPDDRKRLATFLTNPTPDRWHDIHSMIVRPFCTVAQAVQAVDDEFSMRGRVYDQSGEMVEEWPRIPDPITVARAIKQMVDRSQVGIPGPYRGPPATSVALETFEDFNDWFQPDDAA
jgi:hypothetical protein